MKFKIRAKFFFIALLASSCVASQGGTVQAAGRLELVPMGCTVGIQMYTEGVLVAGLATTENGSSPSPAALAGLMPGDLITAVGDYKISSAEDLKLAISKLSDEPISVTVLRGDNIIQVTLSPNMNSGAPELGLWLRDNITGIGTLTFFDPQTGLYGGLGHGINDMDSGVLMPLGRGNILKSSVTQVKKGCAGVPGELCGAFDAANICGSITMNTVCGIFGRLDKELQPSGKAIPVANGDEIELGKATIFCNTKEAAVEEFEVEITRVYKGDKTGRSLMLSVKDERLLERTGGIVQGMSGSPIIQNGKLVGAVTHVMVNDPTKGFGISIENMMAAAEAVQTENNLAA